MGLILDEELYTEYLNNPRIELFLEMKNFTDNSIEFVQRFYDGVSAYNSKLPVKLVGDQYNFKLEAIQSVS